MIQNLLRIVACTRPVRMVIIYKEHIAFMFNCIWAAGFIYWIYILMTIKAAARKDLLFLVNEPGEAIVFMVFGSFGMVYLSFAAWFLIKFIYNFFQSGLNSLFPAQWFSLGRSIIYLLLLAVAFIFPSDIKSAGLTAYEQAAYFMRLSNEHEELAAEKMLNLKRFINALDRSSSE